MRLSAEQLRQFDEQGYLFFPNCFSEDEIALLRDDADAILKLDRQEVWREKTGAPRTAFAAHTFNETFRFTSFSSSTWRAALRRSSLTDLSVSSFSPSSTVELVPLKSKRVDSSRAAWSRLPDSAPSIAR